MVEGNIASARAYYRALGDGDVATLASLLHPSVESIGPLAHHVGRDSLVEAVERRMALIDGVSIRDTFVSGDQVMLALEFDCAEPIGMLSVAALLSFNAGLISRIELFYDARSVVATA